MKDRCLAPLLFVRGEELGGLNCFNREDGLRGHEDPLVHSISAHLYKYGT